MKHRWADFKEAGLQQRVCAVTGSGGRHHCHHVVYRQEVKRHKGEIWDPRNCLYVSKLAHDRHHNAHLRIPMVRLTRENIEFAFELLGPYAYDYLHAHYGGTDIRVTNALIRSEADAA